MKPSILGLLIAAGAFGASTIYLAVQLDEERTRADQVLAESRSLHARIAELESLRTELSSVAETRAGAFSDGGPGAAPLMEAPPSSAKAEFSISGIDGAGVAVPPSAMPLPEPSEAFRKMMRSQVRAHNKRMYSDIGSKLGLTPDDANRLIDLLTDQQVDGMNAARSRMRNGEITPIANDRQKQLGQVADLIGHDKIELFKDYQETLPARQEVAMISRQLEGVDLGLSDTQHQRLVTALSEERKRVPAPEYIPGTSRDDHYQTMKAWQDDYAERSASRVRGVLNSEQLVSYNEYQQWSREMRTQMESRRAVRSAEGNVTMSEAAIVVPAMPATRDP
jgi:hypothetical protein